MSGNLCCLGLWYLIVLGSFFVKFFCSWLLKWYCVKDVMMSYSSFKLYLEICFNTFEHFWVNTSSKQGLF